MNFTPELSFVAGQSSGRLRSLAADDQAHLMDLYQQPELPGQRPLNPDDGAAQDQVSRMIELSVQMAATQRGMMWAIEIEGTFCGLLSVYDWHPSDLRVAIRIDGLPQLENDQRICALHACMAFMTDKYHLRNFAYQWVEGQDSQWLAMLQQAGFQHSARLRQAWKTIAMDGQVNYLDMVQLNRVVMPLQETNA